jgi:hypothetical protein
MLNWKKSFYAALAEKLTRDGVLDVAEVTDFEDYTYRDGYCETCFYETVKCKITFKTIHGTTDTYDYWDSFVELIKSL